MGNQVYDSTAAGGVTYRLYDPHNNMMGMYVKDAADTMVVTQRYIYGSERLGVWNGPNTTGASSGATGGYLSVTGSPGFMDREYELHDQLGNVRASVRAQITTTTPTPQGTKYYNYYAFGSQQPYRCWDSAGLTTTFGFNGQERKDDYMGKGNHNHALYWEYDTRIGRRWNLDPKPHPSISDYATFWNSPIQYADPYGDVIKIREVNNLHIRDEDGKSERIRTTSVGQLEEYKAAWELMRSNLKNIGEDQNFKALNDAPETYWIEFATDDVNSYYRPNKGTEKGGTIVWNPFGGLETESGNIMSPTTVAAHEGEHANGDRVDRDAQNARRAQKCDPNSTDNEEEVRTRKTEQRVAEKKGEVKKGTPVRTNHKGKFIRTVSPTSNDPSQDQPKPKKDMPNT